MEYLQNFQKTPTKISRRTNPKLATLTYLLTEFIKAVLIKTKKSPNIKKVKFLPLNAYNKYPNSDTSINGNHVHPLLNLHSTLAQVPREDITKTKSTVYQQKPFTCKNSQNVNITYSGNSENNIILPELNGAGDLQQQQQLTNTSFNTPDQSVQNDNTQNYPIEEIDS